METGSSLPSSQQPSIGPYPERCIQSTPSPLFP